MPKKLSKITFRNNGNLIELNLGEVYKVSGDNNYRDTPENTLYGIIKSITEGQDWKKLIKTVFAEENPWLYKIITDEARTLFLNNYPLKKHSTILDIGSGWGQFSLPLAKDHVVCSLEPTPERLEFIIAIAKQEQKQKKIFFIGEDYLKVNFETKFDYAICIGVLEWIGLFSNDDPLETQKIFLKKIKKELNKYGKLIIGIENRLGLKYLLGTNDDHTSLPNISLHESSIAKRKYKKATGNELRVFTYSKVELEILLRSAGFSKIKFFAALPDYKLPEAIIPLGQELEKYLKYNFKSEFDGSNGKRLTIQKELESNYKLLSELNIASKFVPSFYIEAN
jgi:2-polyprenyl-3-methyl-5-hydroxy-6-metoxy-1,4-benzoquinol methylase